MMGIISEDDLMGSLRQIMDVIRNVELKGELPDQNLKSWRNALEYCMGIRHTLGDPN